MRPAYLPSHRRPNSQHGFEDEKHNIPASRPGFDSETGQVFQETEISFKKRHNSDWIGEIKTPQIVKRHKPSDSGSRSLLEAARIKCAREIRNLTPQHFEAVPWSIASTIWAEIISSHSESFHAWRTFASVYNHRDELAQAENRYHLEIKQPPLSAQEYFHGINSIHTKWLSALRISPKQTSVPDLVAVANITNLSVLDLSDGQLLLDTRPPVFDERIFRVWSDLAVARKAFQHLQVLMLGWQDNVSDWIFRYLEYFPSLRHIVTTDCKQMHQKNRFQWEETAKAHGWTAHHAKRSVKMLRPLLDDKQFYTAAVSSMYYYSQGLFNNTVTPKNSHDHHILPVVECWLGTPRLWTHIIDEFPGTRTIWFEKTEPDPRPETDEAASQLLETDSNKRLRDTVNATQSLPSPPRKRSQGGRQIKVKGSANSVTSLLQEMGAMM